MQSEAARWYTKAADQGHAYAQCSLGGLFLEGRGVAKSDVKAALWYRKESDRGDAYAQSILGLLFSEGRGVVQSDSKAVHWYRKAADQGNPAAQHNLGGFYIEGRGVAQNDADVGMAVVWNKTMCRRHDGSERRLIKGLLARSLTWE